MATFKVDKQPDNSITIHITIPWADVLASREAVIDKTVETAEIKGFRKGKAPRDLVAKSLDASQLLQDTLSSIIPSLYASVVKEHNLKPIILPQIHIDEADEGKDWHLHAITAEAPSINLDRFKDKIKGELATSAIWTPAQGQEPDDKKTEEQKKEEKLTKVIEWILKNISVQIPEVLLAEETNRLLTRLFDQLQKLGLTVDQYLASKGKTADQLRDEFKQTATENIQLELVLDAIASQENTRPTDDEINKWIESADPQVKPMFENQAERAQLKAALTRQKTLDFLVGLS